MAINKSVAAIVVAFVTGLSPMGVILTQGLMEQRKMEPSTICVMSEIKSLRQPKST